MRTHEMPPRSLLPSQNVRLERLEAADLDGALLLWTRCRSLDKIKPEYFRNLNAADITVAVLLLLDHVYLHWHPEVAHSDRIKMIINDVPSLQQSFSIDAG